MTRFGHWILDDDGNPVECDLMTWARFFAQSDQRVVKKTQIGPYEVSTVFLGIDHNLLGDVPHLWETMVFSNGHKRESERCERCGGNRADALAMHERVCHEIENPVWPPA